MKVSCPSPWELWQRKVIVQLQFSPLTISKDDRITGLQIRFPQPPTRWLKTSMLPPKHTLTLQPFRRKSSLPLMLWVWSTLIEKTRVSWHLHLVTVYARFKENLPKLLCLLAFFQIFSSSSSFSSIHFPLKAIWQMGNREFSPAIPEQLRRKVHHSPPGTAEQGWHQTPQSLPSS